MKYTHKHAIALLQDIIDDKPRLQEWDDLVSIRHSDPFTEGLAKRLLYIQSSHADIAGRRLFDDAGEAEVRRIIEELRASEW